ncbi:hypothetical protein G5C60_37310 [Streptomyces sp. HC44]|uniref:Dirigent-like protein n=1 Tax=Streptomyces scabichelini TaxID=2711217 RepID=A0A6G4VG34_9ACTN|nr:hypothetical protein [Streptomyces scabichelini]NGO13108.1 hypothetical protein [Streptomyces scabichelini]
MSRSFRRIGALGASVTAAVAFGVPASATTTQTEDLDFTLYAREVPGDEGDEGEGQAPGIGDSFAFAEDLSRTKGGDRVGRGGVTCTVVRTGNPGDLHCVGTYVLSREPGGQLTAQTLMAFDPSDETPAAFDIAITGGTGDFRDARGSIRSTPDGDYDRLEFHISR